MSSSPPPTPPSRSPNDDECRFKVITSPCEWVEDYRPGGYHPVHLGDTFHGGQYKVIRKLGEGSFSTVWLAHDLIHKRYIALKIQVSQVTTCSNELPILRHIARQLPEQAEMHVMKLLDEFQHNGPNGTHSCIVFEPMGPSVNTMVEELPQFKPRKFGMKIRYPPPMAKSILKQCLQALEFLHKHGISHGDLQPGNILFALQNIDSMPEEVLRQEEDVQTRSISPPVERLDGKKDLWAPRYLCIAQPLVPFTNHDRDFKVKLSDMGGGLRPPELILNRSVDKTLDIWSFGCLVFELVTGQPLFCIPGAGSQTEQDDDHLLALTARLGVLPDNLYRLWKTSSLYFTPERELYNCQLGGVKEGEEPLMVDDFSMEQLFDQARPDVDENEARQIKMLIREILQYDPTKRPLPSEILDNLWFKETASNSSLDVVEPTCS
ncbi:hypothetical protein N0V84_012332 [Fusarium piperis]|uniref:non-specific serine/threonine protein kinase n=1 Tax=Fusarium piperis TaxID=1435070 RepID=A0A9W8TAF0_9HYPO|nr:hypothetical protein N0V84_012332 [Fusarium piperis]